MSGGFDALGLMPELIRSISELGWTLPTPVQDEAIPLILGGGDVMVASETGTGKTAAFCLPIIQCVHERLRNSTTTATTDTAKAVDGPTIITLSSVQKDAPLSIAEGGLTCTSTVEKKWIGARGSHGVRSGNHYYEATIHGKDLCRLGWSTSIANLELGKDPFGFGFGGTGTKVTNNEFESFGEKFSNNDTIGCYLNWKDRKISYTKNKKPLGVAFSFSDALEGSVIFPAIVLQTGSLTVNFGGDVPFKSFIADLEGTVYSPINSSVPADLVSESSKDAFTVKGKRFPLAIIMEPTKELAEQVYNDLIRLTQYVTLPQLNIISAVGGDQSRKQSKDLSSGVDIIVGSPDRLLHLLKSGDLDLSQIRFFVLDEADALVRSSSSSMMQLFDACPSGGHGDNRLQVCFFSATLHSFDITNLAQRICLNPTWVDLKGANAIPDTVIHVVYRVDPAERCASDVSGGASSAASSSSELSAASSSSAAAVVVAAAAAVVVRQSRSYTDHVHVDKENNEDNVDEGKEGGKKGGRDSKGGGKEGGKKDKRSPHEIQLENKKNLLSQGIKDLKLLAVKGIIDKLKMTQAIIFCRTNVDCDNLESFFAASSTGRKFSGKKETGVENPYSCCVLGAKKSDKQRRENLEAFKDGDVKFLICTDVASRGIDVKELPYVINMTLPDNAESYIHRIGRVGRADTAGLAISLVAARGVEEKVWYHTCRNRPDSCRNRTLTDEGGCCTWIDETALLAAVEERLCVALPELESTYDLPESVRSMGIVFGKKIKQVGGVINLHTEQIGPILQQLRGMEDIAQNNFLMMQSNFGL